MDMSPDSKGRAIVALCVIAGIAIAALFTMEPGKFRFLVWLLMGFIALRICLVRLRLRYSNKRAVEFVERETTQVGGWERRRSRLQNRE